MLVAAAVALAGCGGGSNQLHHRREAVNTYFHRGEGAAVRAYQGRLAQTASLLARVARERQRLVNAIG